jgi:hypothetical protein
LILEPRVPAIEQTDAPGAEFGAGRVHVAHPVREMLQPRTGTAEEPRDRRAVVQRGEQLDLGAPGPGVGGGEHRLGDALALVDLAVHQDEPEHVGVEADRRVEVTHRDAHVVERDDPRQPEVGEGVRVGRRAAEVVDHALTVGPGATALLGDWARWLPQSTPMSCWPVSGPGGPVRSGA